MLGVFQILEKSCVFMHDVITKHSSHSSRLNVERARVQLQTGLYEDIICIFIFHAYGQTQLLLFTEVIHYTFLNIF